MNLVLQREPSAYGATVSAMRLDGMHICDILEDEVREIAGQPVESWKLKGKTAIPVGNYRVTFEQSARFGPDTLTLNSVPGFTSIRIHAGNASGDTEGCLLPGTRSGQGTIASSRTALIALKLLLRGHKDVTLSIRAAPV